MNVVNLKMIANPLNWVTLAIWLAVGAMFLAASGITVAPADDKSGK